MFWVLPLITYHMAITRLRNIAEHAVVLDNDDPYRNARTTLASPLARLFLAPYWVNYHVEHHLLMHVPCYRLRAMHKALLAAGYGDKMEIAPNYLTVLSKACSKSDDQDRPGKIVHDGRRRVSGNFTEGFAEPPTA
jgi:fatty acid desaturase